MLPDVLIPPAGAAAADASGEDSVLVVDDDDELPWLQAAKAAMVSTATMDERMRMRKLL
jgi:hypothetical protein